MEDASLEDFAAGEDPDRAPTTERDASESPAEGGEAVVVTYAWSPDGEACAACGTRASARWHDEPGLVCGDCKDW